MLPQHSRSGVAGSSNDFGQSNSELLSATVSTLTILRSEFPNAEIIGLSAVRSEAEPPAQLDGVNSQMQTALAGVRGRYLDIRKPPSEQPEFMQGDNVHPRSAGQQVLGAAIENAISLDQPPLTNSKEPVIRRPTGAATSLVPVCNECAPSPGTGASKGEQTPSRAALHRRVPCASLSGH